MSPLVFLISLVALVLFMWATYKYVLQEPIRTILLVIMALVFLILILKFTGLLGELR